MSYPLVYFLFFLSRSFLCNFVCFLLSAFCPLYSIFWTLSGIIGKKDLNFGFNFNKRTGIGSQNRMKTYEQ